MQPLDPAVAAVVETAAIAAFGPAGGAGAKLVTGIVNVIAARQQALGRTMSHDEVMREVMELVSHPLPMPVDVANGTHTS
jgi:hypothetical protein